MIRYGKYFLQHALWLDDGFCQYYVQDDAWDQQEILDVETMVFFWPDDARQWLRQCAEFDYAGTLYQLRDYLSGHSLRPYPLYRMDDAQVMRAAANELTDNMSRVVIQPHVGWAVQLDKQTGNPELPPRVEPEPELGGMLAELKEHLDALVEQQQQQHDQIEARIAQMSPEQKALFYSQKAGSGVYDSVIGDTWEMVKAAPSVLWKAAKAFPGFYAGYLKTMWKVSQTPSRMAALTAKGIATGDYSPLKQEIDKIVTPVAMTCEQAVEYKSMLTVLFGDEQVYALLYDFSERYYKATHPVELTQMAASAVADIVVTVILAIVTAGAGAAANVAAKSGRLVKVAKLLEKIAATLRRIGPKVKFIDKGHDAAGAAVRVEKRAARAARKQGVPDVDSPRASKHIDKKSPNEYDVDHKGDGPKKTKDPNSEDKSDNKKQKKASANVDRKRINELVNAGKINEAREILRPYTELAKSAKTPSEKRSAMKEIIDRLDFSSDKEKVFWSGDKKQAGIFAEKNGKCILEHTSGGKILDDWDEVNDAFSWNQKDTPPHGWDFWGDVSERYAKGAEGSIDVIQTGDKFPGGGAIWRNREWPIIRDGGKVNNITIHRIDDGGDIIETINLNPRDPATSTLFEGV
jgi:hypothetical protein